MTNLTEAKPARRFRPPSLLQSMASNWLGLIVGVAITFFLSPFVVKKLGATWFGVWAIAGQVTGYLWLLDFGIRESIIRYVAKFRTRNNRESLNRVLTTGMMMYLMVAVASLCATAVIAWGAPYWFDLESRYWGGTRIAIVLVGLTIAQSFLFNIFTGIVMGLRRWDISAAIGISLNIIRAGLLVVFLLQGHGIIAVAFVYFAVSLLGGLITAKVAVSLLRASDLEFNFNFVRYRHLQRISRRLIGHGFYVAVNNTGEKLITATDAIVVGMFLPMASVAYYAVASSLTGFVKGMVTAVSPIFNPLASTLHAANKQSDLRHAILLGVVTSALVTLPVATTFVVLGEQFIRLWMGEEFAKPSGVVLAALAVGVVFAAPRYVITNALYGLSRHSVTATLRLVEAVTNLCLSIILVQTMGLVGVAFGTVVPAAAIAIMVLPVVTRSRVGIRLRDYYERAFVRPTLAILPMSLGALWVREYLPAPNLLVFTIQVAALTIVYVPCALWIGFRAEERRLVLNRLRVRRSP